MQRFNERLTFNNARLVERYLELKLLLRIRFVFDGSNEQLEASLQWESRIGRPDEKLQGGEESLELFLRAAEPPGHISSDVHAGYLAADREQQAVLVDDVSL